MLLISEPSVSGKPSTTIKGLLPAVKVPMPRTLMTGLPPGAPEGSDTCTPAIFPESADAKLVDG